MKKSIAQLPYAPANYKAADAFAIQQVIAGVADSFQQQRAMKWIIEQAAGKDQFHYYPTDRDTAFALGRAFVGQQVVKMSQLNTSVLRRMEENEN